MAHIPEMVRRQQATAATEAKYRNKTLDWGKARTCVHMARSHLKAMGHKVPKMPQVRSPLGARQVMKARKWKTCADILDAQPGLVRIAPAAMRLGDLAFRHGEDEDNAMGGILIYVAGHKLMGWFGNEEAGDRMVVMDMTLDQLDAAWRV